MNFLTVILFTQTFCADISHEHTLTDEILGSVRKKKIQLQSERQHAQFHKLGKGHH